MPPEPIITVEHLSKRYRLGTAPRHTSLRDTLSHGARNLFSRFRPQPTPPSVSDSSASAPATLNHQPATAETAASAFYALRDVSFAINQGEVVGVVGRNGAGKSTLLKILSRITEPTTGRITLHGRVASLLEVGTGFHGELSGRENIFLNGAILGMSRAEIRQKFDEIVAFAEVEQFLDTPVKRYSSGMYVRLAFAVAAHLEPEILIVDEVLAVGDAAFQKKCLGKMQAVAAGEGRTVIFVSHNLTAMERLCPRSLFLQKGQLVSQGPTTEILRLYTAHTQTDNTPDVGHVRQRSEKLELISFQLWNGGSPTAAVASGDTCEFRLHYRCREPAALPDGLVVTVLLYSRGLKVVNLWSQAGQGHSFPVSSEGRITCVIPQWPLRDDVVRVDLHIAHRQENLIEWEDALRLESRDGDFYRTGYIPHETEGILHLPHAWKIATNDSR